MWPSAVAIHVPKYSVIGQTQNKGATKDIQKNKIKVFLRNDPPSCTKDF